MVDRAGSGSVRVPCWGASVIGGIQPKKIKEMARDLDSDRLSQRFLPIWGGGVRPPQHDRPPNARAKVAYSNTVRAIAEATPVFTDFVCLSPEAQKVWHL